MPSPDARDRLLTAAAELLDAAQGAEVSTRAITERAGVQAPTLYHHFGSKRGLEDAVVTHGFKRFLADREAAGSGGDPIEAIRRGWDLHVRYGVEHPTFYGLIYGQVTPGKPCGVVAEVEAMILRALQPAAAAGRLRVPAEQAAREVLAASTGVVLTLITTGADASLSEDIRDAVLARLVIAEGPVAEAAAALDAVLDDASLSPGELILMREWLHRLGKGAPV
ncbi:TetR/AcrR family transcriptional regulator [Solirubrobacter taibaiensis]|nr:TetR/AcrR family transcriptional regulator [Solirubrobacter taibaiensis]